jgi:hypothetical protein
MQDFMASHVVDQWRCILKLAMERQEVHGPDNAISNAQIALELQELSSISWLPTKEHLAFTLGLARAIKPKAFDHLEAWQLV